MTNLTAIAGNLPRLRLTRDSIARALGWLTPAAGAGNGVRTLAFWDEDSVTLATAAARRALQDGRREQVEALYLATATPPFAEPQCAALTHAALRLPPACRTEDMRGGPRAGLAALHAALEAGRPALVAAADIPVAKPGSAAESRAGDGGAAALVGQDRALLRYLGGASLMSPLIDSYRAADAPFAQGWEERWIRDEGVLGVAPQAIEAALRTAGVAPETVDHLILGSPAPGAAAAVARAAGLRQAKPASDLSAVCGDTGAAHALLMLAHAMEGMKSGDRVVVVQVGQGATALIFEAGEDIAAHPPMVSQQLADGVQEDAYLKLPLFRGLLPWEQGLRGRTPVNEALTTAFRQSEALLGFVGGRCRETGRVQFPPSRLTAGGGLHVDAQEPWPLADRGGCVATCTQDRLAFSRHPPSCYGLVDFNGGGRLMMDFTDPEADGLTPGDAVRFVFRVKDIDERTGFRRYFWKAARDPSCDNQTTKESRT